jgi:hypothetical protein
MEIYVGASAPLIAWLPRRGRSGVNEALAHLNCAGALSLTNVVIRAELTVPRRSVQPDHAEVSQSFGSGPADFANRMRL